jgi:DNA-binding transcriptional LysR family regulator
VNVVRRGHPLAACAQDPQAVAEALAALDFVAVRTHADTTRVLRLLQLEAQLRLTVEHFTALPSIVLSTDLAAVMPHAIHDLFPPDRFAVVDPRFPLEAFTVSLHWSRRFADEPANRWFRQLMADCGGEPGPA